MRTTVAIEVDGNIAYLNQNHIRVLRLDDGDEVNAVLPDGNIALCKLINAKKGIARILKVEKPFEGKVHFILLLPLLKKGETDEVVRFVSTLGNATVLPVITRRTEVKPSEEKVLKMLSRWEKIAYEQAKISHAKVITILPPQKLEDAVDVRADLKIVFWEKSKNSISGLTDELKKAKSLAIAMGPEGGISEEEVELLKQNGWKDIGLSERIIPASLFPIYIISAFDFLFNFVFE